MKIWEFHETKLKELNKLYKKISKQTQSNLQTIFDNNQFSFEELNKYANNKKVNMIKAKIEEWKDKKLLDGYFGVLANNLYRRLRIKNSEILQLLIYGAYIEEQDKLRDKELNIMKEDVNYYYIEGQKEVNNTLPSDKKKPISLMPDSYFWIVLGMMNAQGYIWEEYQEMILQYNAQQMYRQVTINIQQNKENDIYSNVFQNIIKKQQNTRLNINGDKISGAIDSQLIGMNNKAKIDGMSKVDKDTKVRFIAVEDKATTLMCHSLNGQIFSVKGENEFNRYYGETNKELRIERIKCKGLVIGLNLPPISHHFHWCRSSIVYNSNYTSKDFNLGNVLGEEQQKAIVQYLKSNSYKINEKLYNNKELSKEDKDFISNLDDALKGMPIYKGWVNRSVFVRDTKDIEEILSIFNNKQRIGHWKSYTSASLNIYDNSFKMQIKIKSKTGSNLSSINNEGGGEILFMRNTDFQLLDIENKNGIIYVKLEEV